MSRLVAIALPAGPRWVDELERVWAREDAVLPVDPRLPIAEQRALIERFDAAAVIGDDGETSTGRGRPVEPGDALVVASSGSTGESKGAVLTRDGLRAGAIATSEALAVDPSTDRWLCCLPLAHVGGLGVVVRALETGAPIEVQNGIDGDEIGGAVQRGATLTSLVPAVLARVDVRPFRTVLLGGSSIPADRPPNTVATYGMTETGGGIVYDGRPLRGVDVDLDEGEVMLRAPMLLREYRNGDAPVDADGWYRTGDAGRLAADGRLEILGRLDDLIITGGENVWPTTVERAVALVPGIARVAVVGRPDPRWGQVVTAVVVPNDGAPPPTLAAIRAAVDGVLPSHARPRAIEIVDRLPTTALGKVRRSAL